MPSENVSLEKKLRHLNAILRAIRNVNQLIVSETDWRILIKRACDMLKENQEFKNAWIVLFDDEGAYLHAAQAGVGKKFSALKNRLKEGTRDYCLQAALKQESVVAIHDPYKMCGECPLHDNYSGRGGLSVRLQHENRLYGALTVSVSPEFIDDADVHELLREVAGDLAFALHSLALDDERKMMEAALREREENLRITLNSIGDAVISTDVNGNIVRLNPVAEQLTGWSKEAARGLPLKKVFRIINEETRKKVENPVAKVMREGHVVGLANHTLLISRDGRETPIADSGAPIMNDDGQIVGIVLVFRDQTKEREAQREIAEAKHFAENIIATVREPLLVLDAQLKVVAANQSFYRKFKIESAETENQFLFALGNGQWDVPTLKDKLLEIISQNKIVEGFEVEQDFAKIGQRIMQLNARRLSGDPDSQEMILLAIEDVTERKQAEELRTRLAAIVESSDDAIIGKTIDGIITTWNDAAEKNYGYSAVEIIGRHISRLIPKDRREEMSQILRQIKQGESTPNFETVRLQKDGRIIHVSVTVSPIIGAGGEILGAASIARDITVRRQSEDLLHEHAAWNQLILATTLDGFILADTEGAILDVNSSYCRLVGYSRDELLTMNIRGLEAQLSDDEVTRRIQQMVNAGFDRFETQHLAKDGRVLDLDVSIAIVQVKENPPKVAAFVRDITEQKNAQQALQKSEVNLRTTLNSIGDAVIATDAEGKITAINPVAARLTAWRSEEAIGQPIAQVFHIVNAFSQERIENPAALVMKTGEIVGLANHTMLLSKDGNKYQIADSGAPIKTTDGQITGVVLVFRDVTADYEKEQQLKLYNLKLKQAQEIASVGWWEWNIATGEICFSEELSRLHGLPQSEKSLTIDSWLRHVHPKDRGMLRGAHEASFATGALQVEFRIKRHDTKEQRFFKAKGIVRFSAAGEPEYQFGVAIDITEEERAKEALRESEEKFSKAFMASPVLKTITRLDSGEIIDVNDSFVKHTGYSRDELIGKKTTALNLWADPGQRQEILDNLAAGKMVRSMEVQVRTKTGDILETLFSTEIVTIESKEYLISIAVDVTERKRAEEALHESERHYRALFENSPVPLWEEDFSLVNQFIVGLKRKGVSDFDKYFAEHPGKIRELAGLVRILDVNLAVLDLYEAKTREDLFQGLPAVFAENSFDAFKNELIAIVNGRSQCQFEGVVQTLAGEEKVVHLRWVVVPGYEKTMERVYVSTQDITKLKKTENTLRENEKLLRKIAENFPNSYLSIVEKDFTVGFTSGGEFKKQGLDPDDYVGLTIEQVFGDDAAIIREHYEKTFEGEECSFELLINEQYQHYRTVPLYAEDGSIPRILAVVENITERKRAELALSQSEERFRLAFHTSPDSININRLEDGMYVDINQGFTEITGYTHEDAIGKTSLEIDIWADPADRRRLVNGLRKQGRVTNLEARFRMKDGTVVVGLMSASVIMLQGESHILSVTRNIDEIKQAQQSLQKSEERFRTVVDHAGDALYVADFETEKILFTNKQGCAMLGYSEQELLQLKVSDLDPVFVKEEHHQTLWQQLSFGKTISIEVVHQRKDGSTFPVEVRTGLIEFNGKKAVLGFARDITTRKIVDEAMRESQRQMRTLFSNLPGMAYRCKNNENWTMEFVSDGALNLTGYKPSDLLDDKKIAFADLVHRDDKEFVWQQVQTSLKSKKQYELEYRITRKNKEERWVWERGVGVFDNAQLLALEGFISDITERKQAEEKVRQLNAELERRVKRRTAQLQAANHDLEAFSYSVSHDLRAPLRHIAGFTGMLKRDLLKPEPQPDYYFDKISQAASNMREMIDDLLAFSRIGRAKLAQGDIDLNEIVKSVVSEHEQDIAGRVIHWKIKKLHPIKGDAILLKSVLENLISNAIKFTAREDAAEIEIGSSIDAQHVRIFVKDNGVGFDENYVHKLFNVFQRLHSDEEFQGTGIGLANVKRIIERHGGSVGAKGHEGEGAMFYFTLPRH